MKVRCKYVVSKCNLMFVCLFSQLLGTFMLKQRPRRKLLDQMLTLCDLHIQGFARYANFESLIGFEQHN